METIILTLILAVAGPDAATPQPPAPAATPTAAAAAEFELRTLDGQTAAGRLTELSADNLVLETTAGRATFEAEQLLTLAPKEKPAAPAKDAASVWIELVDGSALVAQSYSVKDRTAAVTLADKQTLNIPTRDIATVRLQPPSDATTAEWNRILNMKLAGDVLVVRKDAAIDYHKGVIGDIGEKTVDLQLDGEMIPVKRPKVFGMIYYHAANRDLPAATCTVVDAGGSRWSARAVTLKNQDLLWTTPSGITVQRPAKAVAAIDFSGGKIVYLSDLKPDSVHWTPFFGTAKEIPAIAEFYAPRMDRGLAAKPLKVEGKEYEKGIALKSRTEMVYRLPGKFSRLKAIAGIDDEVRPKGNVQLVIRGDDRVLLDTTVAGSDPAKAIDLDLTGVRRLTILVDFGTEMDIADYLDLCLARISK